MALKFAYEKAESEILWDHVGNDFKFFSFTICFYLLEIFKIARLHGKSFSTSIGLLNLY